MPDAVGLDSAPALSCGRNASSVPAIRSVSMRLRRQLQIAQMCGGDQQATRGHQHGVRHQLVVQGPEAAEPEQAEPGREQRERAAPDASASQQSGSTVRAASQTRRSRVPATPRPGSSPQAQAAGPAAAASWRSGRHRGMRQSHPRDPHRHALRPLHPRPGQAGFRVAQRLGDGRPCVTPMTTCGYGQDFRPARQRDDIV